MGGTIKGRSRRLGMEPLRAVFSLKEEKVGLYEPKLFGFVFLRLYVPLGQQQVAQLEQVVEPDCWFRKSML